MEALSWRVKCFLETQFWELPGGGTQMGETAVEKDSQEDGFTDEGRHEKIWIGHRGGEKK